MTYRVAVTLTTSVQTLPAGSEAAPAFTRVEILAADGVTPVAAADFGPYEFPGIAEGDYVLRASGIDSTGAVMGVPFTLPFTVSAATAQPAPGSDTVDVQLPSGAAVTITPE